MLARSLILAAVGCLPKQAPAAPPPALQFVESVPVETTLDDPAIADTAAVWLELVGGAERTLDIEQFYIAVEDDPLMDSVLDAVEDAASRGVAVRVVADAKFAETYPEPLARLDAVEGIEVRELDLKDSTGGVQHAKFFVVDGEACFIGSQNWDWRALSHVQELGVLAREPGVVELCGGVFELDWAMAGGEEAPQVAVASKPATVDYGEAQVTVRAVASPESLLPGPDSWDLPALLELIDGAEQKVRIQLLSYATVGYDKEYWNELDAALRRANARRVQVEILVSNWAKSRYNVYDLQSLAALQNVEVRFVNLPEASTGFIPFARVAHSKFMVVDGQRAWLGTSNWSRDYFHASRNLGVVVEGAAFAGDLDRRFEATWDSEYAEVCEPGGSYEPPRKK